MKYKIFYREPCYLSNKNILLGDLILSLPYLLFIFVRASCLPWDEKLCLVLHSSPYCSISWSQQRIHCPGAGSSDSLSQIKSLSHCPFCWTTTQFDWYKWFFSTKLVKAPHGFLVSWCSLIGLFFLCHLTWKLVFSITKVLGKQPLKIAFFAITKILPNSTDP